MRSSTREDVILFIDEIHEIVGAGSAGEGNMDAGNVKPALARGELQLVRYYHRRYHVSLKKDAALERPVAARPRSMKANG